MNEEYLKINVKGRDIAASYTPTLHHNDTILWLGGYLSDMFGSKASFLQKFAAQNQLGFIRFDFSQTGTSKTAEKSALLGQGNPARLEIEESFLQATISDWLEEAVTIYDHFLNEKSSGIIVGSSCGGWIALLLAKILQQRATPAKALILIAPAPDFTTNLLIDKMSDEHKASLESDGYVYFAEAEGEIALPFSEKFITDSMQYHILSKPIELNMPIYIFQGSEDVIVPPEYSRRLVASLPYADVTYSLVKGANHGFSRPQDLQQIADLLTKLTKTADYI